jgi:hypothetical protein
MFAKAISLAENRRQNNEALHPLLCCFATIAAANLICCVHSMLRVLFASLNVKAFLSDLLKLK